ncbi:MAG: aminomethyl-transferring glycine dehydrogenase subunit GcvPA [Deltaproteobacteria bacterium]|nr:aminomethyl-transferring glycine dehydrogenase subunit GcvPA [Deltaproteobacteria bacterium]
MRYIPNVQRDWEEMLREIGLADLEDLAQALPAPLRLSRPLDLPPPLSEMELAARLKSLSEEGPPPGTISFLGAGAYDHFIPAVVDHVLRRSEFYTSYTPYQPEISQGTLQAIFEFQSLICELTGMEVANASVYDGASAVAEAVLMAHRLRGKRKYLLARTVHPEYLRVAQTYTLPLQLRLEEVPYTEAGQTDLEALERMADEGTGAVVLQQPNFFGCLEDLERAARVVHARGALLIVAVAEPLSLALLRPPGSFGADLVVGEAQSLGNALNFGGPYVGFFASREGFLRALPGRLVGETVDREGRRGFVLSIATREQHIRREKATSNICTNQALCALAVLVYLSLLGREGLRELAELNLSKCAHLRRSLAGAVRPRFSAPFFNEFVVRLEREAGEALAGLLREGFIGGLPLKRFYPELEREILVCVTERHSRGTLDRFARALAECGKA